MRLFQNSGIYPGYRPRLAKLIGQTNGFESRRSIFLNDRYGACHFLSPVLDGDRAAFFTNGDDEGLQREWARENGIPARFSLEDILLSQIEHHRTEVFYNLDPMRYGSAFIRRLPGCVKSSIAWRAAPSSGADFEAYDRIVCNFPSILQSYKERGWKTAYLSPAHDPVMDQYASNTERPVDVLFVGGFSRHHRQRAETLEAVARLGNDFKVSFHLDRSRLTRLAESPVGRFTPLSAHRRPQAIRQVSVEPVFGRALYEAISRAKIVLNGAVDMAGADRGNMRCFEAMGCGALMVSDDGNYPAGFESGRNMLTYANAADAAHLITRTLVNAAQLRTVALEGLGLMRSHYSKASQWRDFQSLVSGL